MMKAKGPLTISHNQEMLKIGVSGVPSCGKTTLARKLAGSLREKTQYKTIELVSEYARSYITQYGPLKSIYEQLIIFQRQLDKEKKIHNGTEILITDSPIFLSFSYATELLDHNDPKQIKVVTELFESMMKLNIGRRYDIIFHLLPTTTPIKDGVREEHQLDPKWREEQNARILACFDLFKPKNLIILKSSSLDNRLEECIQNIIKVQNKNGI
jgi:nicotinamide riboside kinase